MMGWALTSCRFLQVLKATPHTVKGKQIDPKPAKARPGIKKIFVGGLESDMPEADIKAYFEKFGPVSIHSCSS